MYQKHLNTQLSPRGLKKESHVYFCLGTKKDTGNDCNQDAGFLWQGSIIQGDGAKSGTGPILGQSPHIPVTYSL